MKAITFLGTANYSPITYTYQGQECRTRFFDQALPAFFPHIEQVLVLVTPAGSEIKKPG